MEDIVNLDFLCDPAFPECIEPATLSPLIGIPLILLFVYVYAKKEKEK